MIKVANTYKAIGICYNLIY